MVEIDIVMKLLQKISLFFLGFIILVFIGMYLFINTIKPVYRGEIVLTDLKDKVSVYFDEEGVPHITAQNEKDAYKALGYVHAQDRLWQMELMRRIAAGRLSEIFGKKTLKSDKLFSGIGIEEASKKTIENLDKSSELYKLSLSYLDGVNQFIEKGATPVEFYMLGIEKEKYTLKDIYNVLGYMSFSFAVAHKTDPMLTKIKNKLPSAYINELLQSESENLTVIKNQTNSIKEESFSSAVIEVMKGLPIPSFIGSNSWVIGKDKTKKGKVIFANDPHIGFSQPSVWYQSHIKTPGYEMYGFHLALCPFPLLGHNKNYAYGLTMFENDDVDFYYEESNPNNPLEYNTFKGYEKYELIDKNIKVKGEKDVTYQIKVSRHGPIVNDFIESMKEEEPIAMQWIYTKLKNQLFEVSYELSHAKSLRDFKAGASKLHAPGLNIMYGDAKDNIAWFAAGKLYKYKDGVNTKTILNGVSSDDDIQHFLDFEENPKAINPSWNYVYSANNQPDTISGFLYPGYYYPKDRASRIEQLLQKKNDFTKNDVAKMIYDVTSATTPEICSFLIKSIVKQGLSPTEKKAINKLEAWKGAYVKEAIGPVIYNRFRYEFLRNTFKDEMGKVYKEFIETPLEGKVFASQVKKETSVWWDDISTKNKVETKKEIVTKSFRNAIAFLQNQLGENVDNWKWKRVVSVEYKHTIGKAGGILRKLFNVGPFEVVGGEEVINNQMYKIDSTGYYKVHGGPSTRRIVDFSDPENSLTILPTGQSGNLLSPYYKNQTERYLKGEFVKMKMNESEIKQSENLLIFKVK